MPDRFPREANVVVEVAVRLVRKKGVIDSESRNVADRKTPLHVRECRLHTEPAGSHVPGCRNQGRCAAPSRRVRVTVDRKNVCARRRSPDAQPGLGRGAPSRACGGGRQGHRHGCRRMTCRPRLQDGDQRRQPEYPPVYRGGNVKIVAALTDPRSIRREGVGLPARAPPIAAARPHPQQQFDMEYSGSAA